MHLVVRLVVHFCNKKNEMFLMVVHLVVHFPLKIDVFRYRNCLFISCFIVVLCEWLSEFMMRTFGFGRMGRNSDC